ncbi:hypothetical protein D3C73_1497460 [compost metagenome]
MGRHMRSVKRIARTERIKRGANVVMSQCDVDASFHKLLDSRDSPPLGICIVPPLGHAVDQRTGDDRQARGCDQSEHLLKIGLVVVRRRIRMGGRHAATKTRGHRK